MTMLKTLVIATVLLPRLAIAQQSQQLPQAETAWPLVPRELAGERQLLRTGLRQGAGRFIPKLIHSHQIIFCRCLRSKK
jgi:hypothetical protein